MSKSVKPDDKSVKPDDKSIKPNGTTCGTIDRSEQQQKPNDTTDTRGAQQKLSTKGPIEFSQHIDADEKK